jgi:hypothetical protein
VLTIDVVTERLYVMLDHKLMPISRTESVFRRRQNFPVIYVFQQGNEILVISLRRLNFMTQYIAGNCIITVQHRIIREK